MAHSADKGTIIFVSVVHIVVLSAGSPLEVQNACGVARRNRLVNALKNACVASRHVKLFS